MTTTTQNGPDRVTDHHATITHHLNRRQASKVLSVPDETHSRFLVVELGGEVTVYVSGTNAGPWGVWRRGNTYCDDRGLRVGVLSHILDGPDERVRVTDDVPGSVRQVFREARQ